MGIPSGRLFNIQMQVVLLQNGKIIHGVLSSRFTGLVYDDATISLSLSV